MRVRIQRQPFQVLASLLEHPGRTVSREEIQHRLWGDQVNVDFDHGLNAAVKKLREALEDPSDAPIYIQTVSRKGYRFVAEVHGAEPPAAVSVVSESEPELTTPVLPDHQTAVQKANVAKWPYVLALAAIAAFIAFIIKLPRSNGWVPVPKITQITHSGRLSVGSADVPSFPAIVTDGTRIYYTTESNGWASLKATSVNGGTETSIQLPPGLAEPEISDISRDGTKLLLLDVHSAGSEHPLWIVPSTGGPARRFAAVSAHAGTWTRDGLHIVYARDEELEIADENGTNARRLAVLPGRAYWLRWSPDEHRLAFTLLDPTTKTLSLWSVTADGSSLRRFFPNRSTTSLDCCGSWMPDGSGYLFQSTSGGFGFSNDLWLGTTDAGIGKRGLSPRNLTNGPVDYQFPVSNLSGSKLFFTGAGSLVQYRVFDPARNEFVPFQVDDQQASSLNFSSDGKWMTWVRSGDSTLWRSRCDGEERVEISPSPLQVRLARWSPDDSQIVLMAREPGKAWRIYIMPATGGTPRPILPGDAAQTNPEWTPDGNSILFARTLVRGPGIPSVESLSRFDLLHSKVTEIPNSQSMTAARYSPNGRYLSAISDRAIMLLDLKSGRWSRLSDLSAENTFWSNSGEKLFTQATKEEGEPLYEISVPGGQARMIEATTRLNSENFVEFRLVGLSGDRPVIAARLATANIYSRDTASMH
ncbi:winged helix-turn-helix domain-containing protein [Tunturiibacter gelidoferens]|uniref:Winged helix-turn-helix domain-containing protein n=1 Tax=Tunturiibacter gelidiferens TaxID=3069689 RepID=A0AAU7YZJ7_9BACT